GAVQERRLVLHRAVDGRCIERVTRVRRRTGDRTDRRGRRIVGGGDGDLAVRAERRLQVVGCESVVQIVQRLHLTCTRTEGDGGRSAVAGRRDVQGQTGE